MNNAIETVDPSAFKPRLRSLLKQAAKVGFRYPVYCTRAVYRACIEGYGKADEPNRANALLYAVIKDGIEKAQREGKIEAVFNFPLVARHISGYNRVFDFPLRIRAYLYPREKLIRLPKSVRRRNPDGYWILVSTAEEGPPEHE